MPDVTTQESKYPVVFLRCRTIAFCAATFFSFLWIILLCIVVFIHWETMDRVERSIIMVLLSIHAVTAIMILVLLIRKFRAWLDAARIALLLLAQLGGAGAFAHWSPRFTCSRTSPDEQGVCKLLILYILISSWIVPALLLAYAGGLGVMSFHNWRRDRSETRSVTSIDEEDTEKGPLDSVKRKQHMSQRSSFLAAAPLTPIATPVYSAFATPYIPPSQRTSTVPTPIASSFQSQSRYSTPSSRPASGPPPLPTPTASNFQSQYQYTTPSSRPRSGPPPPPSPSFGSSLPNPYMVPPLPHHWNAQPKPISPNHTRHFSATLPESIPEEYSDTDSEGSRRSSGRLYKPSRTSRLPYLQ